MMKTYSAKPKDVTRVWYILDASRMPLGRLSTLAARLLIGKDKPSFTPHIDVGDYVVVINAKSLKVSGNKTYYRHSGYPGGLYKRSLTEQLDKDPLKVIQKSIYGMLPANKLRKSRLARLKIHETDEHNHAGQNPIDYNKQAK